MGVKIRPSRATATAGALSQEAHIAVKDGGETHVIDEQGVRSRWRVSRARLPPMLWHDPAEELLSSPYCGWCDHMMNEDDQAS
jgi:hypothetical protein